MFETNEEIAAMVERLYAECEGLNRGDILTHEVIRDVLGCEPHKGHWQHCVTKVRRRLLRSERGIDMLPERTVGYKLLTHDEQLDDMPRYRNLKAYRQERMKRKSLEALPDKNLSQHQRRTKLFLIEMARESERAMRRQMREQVQAIRPTPVNPRRPVLPIR